MSNLILHIATRTRVARQPVGEAIKAYAQGTYERFTREQTGQDMVEYAGVLLVVAIIIAAIASSSIGTDISKGVSSLVSTILNGNKPAGH